MSDEGVGIPEAALPQFSTASAGSTHHDRNAPAAAAWGLGLAIVDATGSAHAVTVTASNVVGGGAGSGSTSHRRAFSKLPAGPERPLRSPQETLVTDKESSIPKRSTFLLVCALTVAGGGGQTADITGSIAGQGGDD